MKFVLVFLMGLFATNVTLASEANSAFERIISSNESSYAGADIKRYKPALLTKAKAEKRITAALPNTQYCKFKTLSGAQSIFSVVAEIDELAAKVMWSLHKKGLIKYVLIRSFDEGESESCSYHQLQIYSTDGYVLELSYDFTT
jgi:hypothetical protein